MFGLKDGAAGLASEFADADNPLSHGPAIEVAEACTRMMGQ